MDVSKGLFFVAAVGAALASLLQGRPAAARAFSDTGLGIALRSR